MFRLSCVLFCACLSVSSAIAPASAQPLSEAARWLQSYLRIDTTNPPGNEHRGAAFLAEILRREGISTRLLVTPEGRTSLYATLPPTAGEASRRGRDLLLMHHVDVVPPGPDWRVEPFSGEVREGELWGRGAVDVKSLGIAQVAAMVDLARSGEPRRRGVSLLAVADEENGGGRGTRWLLEHHEELFADVAAVLNEGGNNRMVNGRLLWWGIEVSQKRPLWLRLSARGRPGHASGFNPRSASHQLIAALDRILELPLRFRVTQGARDYLKALAPLHNDPYASYFRDIDSIIAEEGPTQPLMPGMAGLFLDTVQVTVVRSSDRINTIAAEASAEVDIRLLPDTDAREVLKRLRAAAGDDIDLEVLVSSPPAAPSSTTTEVYRLLERQLGASAPVVPAFISGFTDSRYFRSRGITAYGFSPFALEPQILRGIHAANERIPLAELDRGVERMRAVARAWVAR